MEHYIKIKINADEDIPIHFIRNKVITKLHKALFDLKSTDIGISFPQVGKKLGNTLRIHGVDDKLQKLQNLNWLGGLGGYCDVSEIRQVPKINISYRTVSRVQLSMTQSKLRRLIKRNSLSDEEIKTYKAKMFTQSLNEPYLELFSSTNKQLHRRYIKHGELKNSPVNGKFDQFGLSKNATIPWF